MADAHLSNAVSGANDGCFAVYVTQYRGHKRYCRVVVNLGVTALRGHAHVAPVNA